MKKGLIRKGFNFYKKYGFRGGIATLTGKWQIKDSDYAAWYEKNKVTIEELEIHKKLMEDTIEIKNLNDYKNEEF